MAAPRNENIKEQILNTTEKLLKDSSFSDISLAKIASASEISKGTLYYYYKTKGEILFDLTDRYLSKQWDDLIEWTENKEKDTSIKRLIKYVMERNVASADVRMKLYSEAQMGDEAVRQKLIARYEDFEKLICKKIAERTDLPAEFLTWLILLASDGIIIQETLRNPNFVTDEFINQSAEIINNLEKKK